MSRFVRTYKARKKFLDQLEVGDSESKAARAAGGELKNFRRWRDEDPEFAKDWEDAIEAGTDFIEDVATDRAIEKSDTLMAMILKARRPDKYDRGSKLELSGGISVEGAKSKLLNKVARLQAERLVEASRPREELSLPAPQQAEEKEEVRAGEGQEQGRRGENLPERGRKRRASGEGARG